MHHWAALLPELLKPMQGLYYLLSIVAVFVVFIWFIRNDKIKEGQPSTGLLAMKNPETDVPVAKSDGKRARPGDTNRL